MGAATTGAISKGQYLSLKIDCLHLNTGRTFGMWQKLPEDFIRRKTAFFAPISDARLAIVILSEIVRFLTPSPWYSTDI
jgi:hypothetical protein